MSSSFSVVPAAVIFVIEVVQDALFDGFSESSS